MWLDFVLRRGWPLLSGETLTDDARRPADDHVQAIA
jgi:hypothetical protein